MYLVAISITGVIALAIFFFNRKRVETGAEPGASFAVYHKGKALVDLWGGYADPEALRPWEQNTLSQAWSCTKGVVAVVVAMLVDRYELII